MDRDKLKDNLLEMYYNSFYIFQYTKPEDEYHFPILRAYMEVVTYPCIPKEALDKIYNFYAETREYYRNKLFCAKIKRLIERLGGFDNAQAD